MSQRSPGCAHSVASMFVSEQSKMQPAPSTHFPPWRRCTWHLIRAMTLASPTNVWSFLQRFPMEHLPAITYSQRACE